MAPPATAKPTAEARSRLPLADPRAAALAVLLATALALAIELLAPAPASANPLSEAIKEGVEGSFDWAFEQVVRRLFGGVQGKITQTLVAWLVAIPNFDPSAQQPYVSGPARSNIDAVRQATSMIALGGLAVALTLSTIRYWIAGLSSRGSGGIEAFEGLLRTLLAVGLILLWPDAFRLLVALVNSATDTLMHWPAVEESLATLWGSATGLSLALLPSGIGLVLRLAILMAVVGLLLALVVAKVMLTAGTAIIYVLMPAVLMLLPLPETAWVPRATGRAFVVCLVVPFAWTVIFVTFAALGADFFTLQGQGGVLEQALIKPLVMAAMLLLALTTARSLARSALQGVTAATGAGGGGGGSSFGSRFASNLLSRRADALLANHIPAQLGGRMQPAASASGGLSSAAQTAMAAAGVGGGAAGAAGGVAGAAGGVAGATVGGAGTAGAVAPSHGGAMSGVGTGLPTGAGIPFHYDAASMRQLRGDMAAWRANGGPSQAATWGALGELRLEDQERVGQEAGALGSRDFEDRMLSRAANPSFTAEQQGAWFTLATAGRDGVQDVVGFEEGGAFGNPTGADGGDGTLSTGGDGGGAPATVVPQAAPSEATVVPQAAPSEATAAPVAQPAAPTAAPVAQPAAPTRQPSPQPAPASTLQPARAPTPQPAPAPAPKAPVPTPKEVFGNRRPRR